MTGRFKEGLGPIVYKEFQLDALKNFIKVARFNHVDLTVVVGTYNKGLAKIRSPGLIEKYEHVQEIVQSVLKNEGVAYIDATDLNERHGVFKDQMHLSDYIGHEYIYKKMKEHYEKH